MKQTTRVTKLYSLQTPFHHYHYVHITLLQAKSQATTEATKVIISHSVTNPSGIVLDHISMQILCMRAV